MLNKPRSISTSITCTKIEHIPYNLAFTTKFNDFSILNSIISWDYLNLSLANEYVSEVTIPTYVIKLNYYDSLCMFWGKYTNFQ